MTDVGMMLSAGTIWCGLRIPAFLQHFLWLGSRFRGNDVVLSENSVFSVVIIFFFAPWRLGAR
jgi:hypothetical protein